MSNQDVGGASGTGSRTAKAVAASSAVPCETVIFTMVGADTTAVSAIQKGTRTGTPSIVTGRTPSMVIDARQPRSWPSWASAVKTTTGVDPTSSFDSVTIPHTAPRTVQGKNPGKKLSHPPPWT